MRSWQRCRTAACATPRRVGRYRGSDWCLTASHYDTLRLGGEERMKFVCTRLHAGLRHIFRLLRNPSLQQQTLSRERPRLITCMCSKLPSPCVPTPVRERSCRQDAGAAKGLVELAEDLQTTVRTVSGRHACQLKLQFWSCSCVPGDSSPRARSPPRLAFRRGLWCAKGITTHS